MRPERRPIQKSNIESEGLPAAITDTGCERELNEDRYAVIESSNGVAWVVADGMGGTSGGELAAQLAIDAMRRHLESQSYRDVESALRAAILEANRVIVLRRQNPMFAGMGTTIVAAMFRGSEIALAHAGDSRAYLVRDGSVFHLTEDHTLVQEMVSRGELSAEESLKHPQAHVLTRCLGSEPGLRIDMTKCWIAPRDEQNNGGGGDKLALISDGLYSLVSDAELGAIISDLEPQRACVHLVELAKSRGGFDNITIAIIPLYGSLSDSRPHESVDSKSVIGALVGKSEEEARLNLFWLAILWIVASVAAVFLTLVVYTFTNFA
jgi:serine/threonine protein phosphatase PrpC